VGVLISDHLSKAQMLELDGGPMLSATPIERVARSSTPPLPAGWSLEVTMPTQELGIPRRDVAARAPSVPTRTTGQPSPVTSPVGSPAQDRLALADRSDLFVTVPDESVPAGALDFGSSQDTAPFGFEPVEIAVGRQANNSVDGASEAHHNLLSTIRDLGGQITNGIVEQMPNLPVAGRVNGGGTTQTGVSNSRAEPKAEPALVGRTPVANPVITAARVHYVKPNESLYKIAEQYYGDGNLWRALAEANKGRVGSDGSVMVNVRLEIPERIGGKPTRTSSPAAATPSASPRTQPARQPVRETARPAVVASNTGAASAARTYTVAKGDTLGEISSKMLGSSKRMNEIIAANRNLIDDANEIRIGMNLKIPAR
jgi:nucleoid-associated protein YgaU